MQELGIQSLPITVLHIRALNNFAELRHKDPFDRMIAPQGAYRES